MNNELTLEYLVVGEEYLYDFYDRSGSNWIPVVVDYIGKSFVVAHTADDMEFTFHKNSLDNLKNKSAKVAAPVSVIEFIIECYIETEDSLLSILRFLPEDTVRRLMLYKPITRSDAETLSLILGRSTESWENLDRMYQENKGVN